MEIVRIAFSDAINFEELVVEDAACFLTELDSTSKNVSQQEEKPNKAANAKSVYDIFIRQLFQNHAMNMEAKDKKVIQSLVGEGRCFTAEEFLQKVIQEYINKSHEQGDGGNVSIKKLIQTAEFCQATLSANLKSIETEAESTSFFGLYLKVRKERELKESKCVRETVAGRSEVMRSIAAELQALRVEEEHFISELSTLLGCHAIRQSLNQDDMDTPEYKRIADDEQIEDKLTHIIEIWSTFKGLCDRNPSLPNSKANLLAKKESNLKLGRARGSLRSALAKPHSCFFTSPLRIQANEQMDLINNEVGGLKINR